MFTDPATPEIIEQLNELRIWLDGFLTDRAESADATGHPFEEVWPYAITGDHNDALELVINWLKERATESPKKQV
jgi:hypothetical protein